MGIEITKTSESSVRITYTRASGQGPKNMSVDVPILSKDGEFDATMRMKLAVAQSGLPDLILSTFYRYGQVDEIIQRAIDEGDTSVIMPDAVDQSEIIDPVLQALFRFVLAGEDIVIGEPN